MGTAFRIRFRVDAAEEVAYPIFTVMIDSSAGQRMLTISSPNTRAGFRSLDSPSEVECHIPALPLAPGDYVVRLSLWKVKFLERVEHALTFTVTNADTFGDGWGADRGVCVAPANWTLSADVAASIQNVGLTG